jgi:predicted transcriptional regulator
MAYAFPPDVQQLIREADAFGNYASEDDLLRDALTSLIRQHDDLASIRAGVADMDAGRFRPVREVDAEIRSRLGFVIGE